MVLHRNLDTILGHTGPLFSPDAGGGQAPKTPGLKEISPVHMYAELPLELRGQLRDLGYHWNKIAPYVLTALWLDEESAAEPTRLHTENFHRGMLFLSQVGLAFDYIPAGHHQAIFDAVTEGNVHYLRGILERIPGVHFDSMLALQVEAVDLNPSEEDVPTDLTRLGAIRGETEAILGAVMDRVLINEHAEVLHSLGWTAEDIAYLKRMSGDEIRYIENIRVCIKIQMRGSVIKKMQVLGLDQTSLGPALIRLEAFNPGTEQGQLNFLDEL